MKTQSIIKRLFFSFMLVHLAFEQGILCLLEASNKTTVHLMFHRKSNSCLKLFYTTQQNDKK